MMTNYNQNMTENIQLAEVFIWSQFSLLISFFQNKTRQVNLQIKWHRWSFYFLFF